ncbi:hypothetical protein TNCV_2787031 [Trichonephila clavipes]|nr:hypothetical protein TNCV_2787031 [Trichonephila clavipes]
MDRISICKALAKRYRLDEVISFKSMLVH